MENKLVTQLSISIVMSTYNGKTYIKEQLDSIRYQTLPPTEVIICDDCSTDDTYSIIKKYIKIYQLNNWTLIRNKTNIGWKKNFKYCLDQAKGDIIYLCDQDDIWATTKLYDMTTCMIHNPHIGVLVSNYTIIYENHISRSRYEAVSKSMKHDGSIENVRFTTRWPYVNRPGCTYCIRKTFYNAIKDTWNTAYAHDAILWRNGILTDSLWIINKSLVSFRRHYSNSSGKIDISLISRIKDIQYYKKVYKDYYNVKNLDKFKKKIILTGMQWLDLRLLYLEYGGLNRWLILAIKYRNYYASIKAICADLYVRINKN